MQRKILGITNVDVDLIGHSAFVIYMKINGNTVKQYISCVYSSSKILIKLGGRTCVIFLLSLVSE
jgi:hypothetical protein